MTGLVRWLDAEEVADILDLNVTSIPMMVKAGKFPLPHKATRGRIENGKGRTRSYWKESDILQYKELMDMKAAKVEKYNEELNAKMLAEMRAGMEEFDKPISLKHVNNMPVTKVVDKPINSLSRYGKPLGRPRGS